MYINQCHCSCDLLLSIPFLDVADQPWQRVFITPFYGNVYRLRTAETAYLIIIL